MADLDVRVRLTGESGQLVGQLKGVSAAEAEVAKEAGRLAQVAEGAAVATGKLDQAGRKAESGLRRAAAGSNAMRASSTNLGFQIQDITQQLAIGQNPMMVFGQQAGQTAYALSGLGGAAGRVGAFFAGPWGSIILAAVTVTGLLASSFLSAGDAADKTKDDVLDLSGSLNALAINAGVAEKAMESLRNSMAKASAISNAATQSTSAMLLAMGKSAQLGDQIAKTQGTLSSLARTPGGANALEATVARLGKLSADKAAADKAVLKAQNNLDEIGGLAAAKTMQDRNRARMNDTPDKPNKGPKGPKDHSAAEAEKLAKFGSSAAESITRITEQFDAQPKLVDRVNAATRQLDSIIADLNKKTPKGFHDMIAAAVRAKSVVQQSLLVPFNDYVEASQRASDIQSLTMAGRVDEAEALRVIFGLVERVGTVSEAQRQTILATVKAEREQNEVLARRNVLAGSYTSAIQDARSAVEGLLSGDLTGKDFLKNLRASFNQLRAKVLTEQLLGPFFRDLEKKVQERTGIASSVDIFKEGTEKAGKAGFTVAESLERASGRIDRTFGGTAVGGASGGDTPPISNLLRGQLGSDFDAIVSGLEAGVEGSNEIVAQVKRLSTNTALSLTPVEFLNLLTGGLAGVLIGPLTELLGPKLAGALTGVLAGGAAGYIRAGKVGAVLGGLDAIGPLSKGIDKLFKSTGVLSKALGGAEVGTAVAGVAKGLLGIKKFSTTGSQIGGAIGSAIPIPGGEIIGSVLGGIVGGLFKKSKSGSATLTGSGDPTLSGNNAGFKKAAGGLGGNVQSGLQSLADQLGATIGDFAVSIGIRDGKYRVDPTGKGQTSTKKGALDFGKDGQEDAVRAAIADAVKDGALLGLSAAMQKALQAFGDPDKGLAEALKVRDLEKALGGFSGAARDAFQQFERQAKDRLRIATTYGLAVNKVEELNARDRVKLRDQLEKESFGSLQDLLTRLRGGDLFEGSAVDKRTVLLGQIEATKAKAAAGEEGAADKLAGLLEQLNTVSKDVFGTSGGFAGDRSQIESTAESVIALLRTKLDDAAAQAANPQLEKTNSLLDEGNGQNAQMVTLLASIRDGLGVTAAGTQMPGSNFDLASLAYTGGNSTAGAYGFL